MGVLHGELGLGAFHKGLHLCLGDEEGGSSRLDSKVSHLCPATVEGVSLIDGLLKKLPLLITNQISAGLHAGGEREATFEVVLMKACENRQRPEGNIADLTLGKNFYSATVDLIRVSIVRSLSAECCCLIASFTSHTSTSLYLSLGSEQVIY